MRGSTRQARALLLAPRNYRSLPSACTATVASCRKEGPFNTPLQFILVTNIPDFAIICPINW